MKHRRFLPVTAILILAVLLARCGDKGPAIPASMEIPEAAARVVSEATAGLIPVNGEIRVRFVDPVADESMISPDPSKPRTLAGGLFRFEPGVKGAAFWIDDRTLVFKPAQNLEAGKTYRAGLDLSRAMGRKDGERLPVLPLQFTAAALAIAAFEGDFVLVNGDDPKRLVYGGAVTFTQPVPEKDMAQAVSVTVNNRKWDVSLETEASGAKVRFRTAVIPRDDSQKTVLLRIAAAKLGLAEDFQNSAFMPPLTDMEVTDVSVNPGADETSVMIRFSDELDPRRDIGDRITLTPAGDFIFAVEGKDVAVTGPFDFGKPYIITVRQGIRSKWGTSTRADVRRTVTIEDMKPEMRFSSEGVFVASSAGRKIRFETVNVKQVRLKIVRVFENNLGQFLQLKRLAGRTGAEEWDYEGGYFPGGLERVGVDVADDTLEIGGRRNIRLRHELDLNRIVGKNDRGLYMIRLSFERKDMLYKDIGESPEGEGNYSGDAEDPGSWYYLYNHGTIEKPVVFSDIGLTCKKAGSRYWVIATGLLDAEPMSGVKVTLRTYQNQIAGQGETNGSGVADISAVKDDVFYVEAEKDGQRSAVKPSEMGWSLSGFDTGGEEAAPDGIRAYIYSERGVHRPGDTVYLGCIFRNPDGTFPDRHPVTLKVFNPRNQVVFQETRKDGLDGFTSFRFATSADDPTGHWIARLQVGGRSFEHGLRIETVVPYTLKLNLTSDRKKAGPADRTCSFSLTANYLFGTPAAGLEASVDALLRNRTLSFKAFPQFRFDNPILKTVFDTENLFSGKVDGQGNVRADWELPDLKGAASGLEAAVTGRVIEKGGRPNSSSLVVPVDPYPRYVGIQPAEQANWLRTGAPLELPVILVDPEGNPAAGRTLNVRVFLNRQHWWWEYDDESDSRLRFKTDRETRQVHQTVLTSAEKPAVLSFTPDAPGQYFVEIQDGRDGHTAGFFFSATAWGEVPAGAEGPDLLTLKTDRNEYRPGDKAEIRFPSPRSGTILVTVEKGNDILSFQRAEPAKSGDWSSVIVPVTDRMLPNAYVSVSVIQPLEKTENDRPIRMYGVVPIFAADPKTRQTVTLTVPEKYEPEKKGWAELRTGDGKPAQFTLAVVDEGLLDLTRFETPDPWKAFYRKERLGVGTFDLFGQVAGVNRGDVFRTFAVGGGLDEEYRQSQLGDTKAKRFKPVVFFTGPLRTDKKGVGRVEFDMPNYVGSVRVMAVTAAGACYGSAEKAVPVKSGLMVAPSLPRVLAPNDRIRLPVTVFAMEKDVAGVEVSVKTQGPVRIVGAGSQRLSFNGEGEKDVVFELAVKPAVGRAVVTVHASGGRFRAESVTEIAVRSASPRIYETQVREILPGGDVSIAVPDRGVEGTNRAAVTVWRRQPVRLGERLQWLLDYPYGCIEQTVSAVFPQLYLKKILTEGSFDPEEVDRNINAGITRLGKFQLPSGAFTYWPGCGEPAAWATDYTGRFLVEAKKLGYSVPEDLYIKWLSWEKKRAHVQGEPAFIQVHRLYLLALAGEPQIGAMNAIREDSLGIMNDAAKWMLAGAYRLAGVDRTAQEILGSAGTHTPGLQSRWHWRFTYGTDLRDRALILEQAVLFGRWSEANGIIDEFTRLLNADEWFSTQTLGTMLLAMGKAFLSNETAGTPVLAGSIRLPDGTVQKFKTENFSFSAEIASGFGKAAEVRLDGSSKVARAFVELAWNGVPLVPDKRQAARNLNLTVEWRNGDGAALDPSSLRQGTAFWGVFRVQPSESHHQFIENVALTQVLPSGWEIENQRVTGEDLPVWASDLASNNAVFTDIRDDRIMWFFDLSNNPQGFLVKLNAVTAGEYDLAPALCEAMYDANYQARTGGGKVTVESR
jgi:uncharacterized protein YfaS (alpha-2-macroglobulin family)